MKMMARVFLLLTICVFAGVSSVNAASVPCCVDKAMQDCGSDCQSTGSKADTHSQKQKAACEKCECLPGLSAISLHAAGNIHPAYNNEGLLPSLEAAVITLHPNLIDNPPRSRA